MKVADLERSANSVIPGNRHALQVVYPRGIRQNNRASFENEDSHLAVYIFCFYHRTPKIHPSYFFASSLIPCGAQQVESVARQRRAAEEMRASALSSVAIGIAGSEP